MKIFTQSVYILCKNRERKCAAASEHVFYVEDCATASERKCAADIFYVEANVWLLLEKMFPEAATHFLQCFLKNVWLLLKIH